MSQLATDDLCRAIEGGQCTGTCGSIKTTPDRRTSFDKHRVNCHISQINRIRAFNPNGDGIGRHMIAMTGASIAILLRCTYLTCAMKGIISYENEISNGKKQNKM